MSASRLVSVILIFFDAERFLEEAIESVVRQTYREWELILVDDGSTDRSAEIARSWASRDPGRIRYVSHDDGQNHGKSTSRNLGIRSASGSYVGFLDADDVWLEDILEDQVTLLEANHLAGMVYGPIQWWYSWTGALEDRGRDYVEDLGVPSDSLVYPPTLLRLFLQDRAAVPSAMLIRRDAIDRAGMFEDEFRVLYEDQVFLSKLCLSEVVYASGECWYRYRQHPDSTCARTMITGEYYSTRPIFLRWLAIYLGQRQVRDAELWRAVDEEVWPLKHPIAHRWLERVATRFPVEKWIARTEGALRRSRLAAGLSKAW